MARPGRHTLDLYTVAARSSDLPSQHFGPCTMPASARVQSIGASPADQLCGTTLGCAQTWLRCTQICQSIHGAHLHRCRRPMECRAAIHPYCGHKEREAYHLAWTRMLVRAIETKTGGVQHVGKVIQNGALRTRPVHERRARACAWIQSGCRMHRLGTVEWHEHRAPAPWMARHLGLVRRICTRMAFRPACSAQAL